MCFSASASFLASGILGVVSIISFRVVKNRNELLFAAIPLFFALQQAVEGIVWFYQSAWAAQLFLMFALVIWPTIIPLSLILIEKERSTRDMLRPFVYAGVILSCYLGVSNWWYPAEFSTYDCHIIYMINLIGLLPWGVVALWYCIVTLLPFFISSYRYMEVFGMLVALSCVISYLFFTVYFTSVWCFFAALISTMIVGIVYHDT